ncbi:MAG TPA: FAD-binding oxidoreductase [Pyrinomonadaceae bacterium]|jgi:D-lactate dehydrogenase (cytochrome)
MFSKSQPDEIQSFLVDASNMQGGQAVRVVFPETTEEVAEVLAGAAREGTPVTVSGAGTGIVGGRVPFGGIVLATDRLNKIKEINQLGTWGIGVAEAGVVLADFQRAVREQGLFYPPDPTEWSCYLGGTIATNASGARTFKYGPTRTYIRRLKIALSTGNVLDIKRGQTWANEEGELHLPLPGGRSIKARLPSYRMPPTRKHASGYYITPRMDAIDLFIGSEGTLGVVTEIEAALLPVAENVLSGVVFFKAEENLLAFVRGARALSMQTRERGKIDDIDAEALEYFDEQSLRLLRQKYALIPQWAVGAVFFEQETTSQTEEALMGKWLELLELHEALVDDSWFATTEHDRRRIREFRHQLPVLVNEWLARHNQRKISTDMAVPDDAFPEMLRFYQETLCASGLQYVIFGHVGDNHVHVNIMPRDDAEVARAREIYLNFVRRAVLVGGTVSAEHGIGKLKREYLRLLYSDEHLREMAALKRAFDPACILGRGNIFAEELL